MRKIRYKVVQYKGFFRGEIEYKSVYALPRDKLYYEIGRKTQTRRIPASKGYYIAVFNNLQSAKSFIEINCMNRIDIAILKVEVYGKHRIKRLPLRLVPIKNAITSFFASNIYGTIDSWPIGTELWEKVKPIEEIYRTGGEL